MAGHQRVCGFDIAFFGVVARQLILFLRFQNGKFANFREIARQAALRRGAGAKAVDELVADVFVGATALVLSSAIVSPPPDIRVWRDF